MIAFCPGMWSSPRTTTPRSSPIPDRAARSQEVRSMDEAHVTALSAKQGDACLRDVPRLLTKEEIRSLSEIDSGKAMLAFAVEILLIAAVIALSEMAWFNPLIYLLAVIVIGTRI